MNIQILKKFETDIISHMNDCHQESIDLYVSKLLKVKTSNVKEKWKIIGIDPDGFDLRKKKELLDIVLTDQ